MRRFFISFIIFSFIAQDLSYASFSCRDGLSELSRRITVTARKTGAVVRGVARGVREVIPINGFEYFYKLNAFDLNKVSSLAQEYNPDKAGYEEWANQVFVHIQSGRIDLNEVAAYLATLNPKDVGDWQNELQLLAKVNNLAFRTKRISFPFGAMKSVDLPFGKSVELPVGSRRPLVSVKTTARLTILKFPKNLRSEDEVGAFFLSLLNAIYSINHDPSTAKMFLTTWADIMTVRFKNPIGDRPEAIEGESRPQFMARWDTKIREELQDRPNLLLKRGSQKEAQRLEFLMTIQKKLKSGPAAVSLKIPMSPQQREAFELGGPNLLLIQTLKERGMARVAEGAGWILQNVLVALTLASLYEMGISAIDWATGRSRKGSDDQANINLDRSTLFEKTCRIDEKNRKRIIDVIDYFNSIDPRLWAQRPHPCEPVGKERDQILAQKQKFENAATRTQRRISKYKNMYSVDVGSFNLWPIHDEVITGAGSQGRLDYQKIEVLRGLIKSQILRDDPNSGCLQFVCQPLMDEAQIFSVLDPKFVDLRNMAVQDDLAGIRSLTEPEYLGVCDPQGEARKLIEDAMAQAPNPITLRQSSIFVQKFKEKILPYLALPGEVPTAQGGRLVDESCYQHVIRLNQMK